MLPSFSSFEAYHLNWITTMTKGNKSAQMELILTLLRSKLTDKDEFRSKLTESVSKRLGPQASKDDINMAIHYAAKYDLYESLDLVALGKRFAEDNQFDFLQALLGKRSAAKDEIKKPAVNSIIETLLK